MIDDPSHWAKILQWVLSNPEKVALFLVLVTGAWRWIRELRKEVKEDSQHESFTEMLLRENKERLRENQELRAELRELRRKNGNGHRPPE